MPINFPNGPATNDTYSYDTKSWIWSGSYWKSLGTTNYVSSFNGLTGAVTGASLGANTFTALNTFNAGISASGSTFDGNIYVTGNLIVTGRIETSTGIFGATANAIIEPVDNMNLDGGEF